YCILGMVGSASNLVTKKIMLSTKSECKIV
ncbi:unnamed protein product, partial [marine sediment metagenome]